MSDGPTHGQCISLFRLRLVGDDGGDDEDDEEHEGEQPGDERRLP